MTAVPLAGAARAALDRLAALPADGPGLAAAVLIGGRVAWSRCAGLASLQHRVPIGPGTRFHVVSCTKPFTAATVLSLAAAGRLSLDDDVRRHLPEMAVPDHGRPVRLRHLLSMTSGLRDVLEIARLAGAWHAAPSRPADLLDEALRQARTSAPPGARFLYVNANFVLLDAVLRRIDGRSANAARRAAVYGPLGLAGAADRAHDGMVTADLAEPYVAVDGGWRRATEILGICGDPAVASLDDMTRWAAALRDGRIGDVATAPIMAERSKLADGRLLHYGLGLFARHWRGLAAIGHFGSQPGYKSGIVAIPARDVAVVLLTNREDLQPGRLVPQMLEAVLPDVPSLPPQADGPPMGEFSDPETGEWIRLGRDAGGPVCETIGPTFHLCRDGAGWRDDGELGSLMPLTIVPAATGALVVDLGGAAVRLSPVGDGSARTVDPDAYAGVYEGADIASRHTVRNGPRGLEIVYGVGGDRARVFPMRAVGRDLFLVEPTAPGIAFRHALAFRRDGRGRVRGAVVTMERLKGVELDRTR
ncbi:MAG: beta-lactamase family protein [Alphaproteobacteria bacterium]|nr:beta-lactamase family protein [Alphaproteobacteria bacterium]